jgi:hypothetical protein
LATRATLGHRKRSAARRKTLRASWTATVVAADSAVARRKAYPRFGMLGMPLAIASAALLANWSAFPLLAFCAWWTTPHSWGWEWLVAVGRGIITAEWAYAGSVALGAYPSARGVVGALWVCLPIALVIVASRIG